MIIKYFYLNVNRANSFTVKIFKSAEGYRAALRRCWLIGLSMHI